MKSRTWTLIFIGTGFAGAAMFYSYLIGLNLHNQAACPVCPHILSLNHQPPVLKFLPRVLIFGTLNAAVFTAIGWFFLSAARLVNRILTYYASRT